MLQNVISFIVCFAIFGVPCLLGIVLPICMVVGDDWTPRRKR